MTSVLMHERKSGKSKKAVDLNFSRFLNISTFPVVVVCELELLAVISFINSWLKKQEYEGVNMCI